MKEAENVKKVYDQIHAPEALLGKVMEMKKDTFKFRNCVKYAVAAVAALVFTFVASNGICYAATGQTWISKIKININGNEVTPDVTWEEKDGNMVGTFKIELDSVDEETGEKDEVYTHILVGTYEMESDSGDKTTGEKGKVSTHIEVQPDGVNAKEVDELEDTVITVVVTGEHKGDCSVSVDNADDEMSLSIDTNKSE